VIQRGSMPMSRKAYFFQAAETWDQKYCTPELEAFLEKLLPNFGLKPGQTVLDAGTGTGVLIPFLLTAIGSTGSITAIDYSENMIQKFRSKFANCQNVRIELQDVEELDLPPESFDAAICFGLFPHLERKAQALMNLNRVLKRRGRLVIAHALSSAEIKAHHKGAVPVAQDHLPEETEMKHMLRQAGFSNIHIKDEPALYLCLATKNITFQKKHKKPKLAHNRRGAQKSLEKKRSI
jgi:cyclopropane fatty-acyl-phospholipid synthase-like methyltransferase